MDNPTVQISDLMISHPDVTSFESLKNLVKTAARAGAVNLSFDLKPEYQDTPRDWREQLEIAFLSVPGGSLRR